MSQPKASAPGDTPVVECTVALTAIEPYSFLVAVLETGLLSAADVLVGCFVVLLSEVCSSVSLDSDNSCTRCDFFEDAFYNLTVRLLSSCSRMAYLSVLLGPCAWYSSIDRYFHCCRSFWML